jgi:hypothetical protein
MFAACFDQSRGKVIQSLSMLVPDPLHPGYLLILAVRVVITLLSAPAFVTSAQHRHALREKKCTKEIALLSPSESVDFWISCRTFGPAVPRLIAVVAVLIVFAARLVVFIVIGNQVRQSVAVMRGYEIYARLRVYIKRQMFSRSPRNVYDALSAPYV